MDQEDPCPGCHPGTGSEEGGLTQGPWGPNQKNPGYYDVTVKLTFDPLGPSALDHFILLDICVKFCHN